MSPNSNSGVQQGDPVKIPRQAEHDLLADWAARPVSIRLSAEVREELDLAAELEATTAADIAGQVIEEWAKRPRQRRPS